MTIISVEMQSIKTYLGLPSLRLPGWSELRDGSFFSRALEADQQNAAQTSVLRELEGKLVRLQEAAMWTRPGLSVVTLMVTQASLYYLTSVSLVTSLACALLCLYLCLTWVTRVWPAIRVAPAPGSQTFTPGHPDLMSIFNNRATCGLLLSPILDFCCTNHCWCTH